MLFVTRKKRDRHKTFTFIKLFGKDIGEMWILLSITVNILFVFSRSGKHVVIMKIYNKFKGLNVFFVLSHEVLNIIQGLN
jgi:CRISPR/Cas system endoribonuclease Cas6 (RAMP superfamily)